MKLESATRDQPSAASLVEIGQRVIAGASSSLAEAAASLSSDFARLTEIIAERQSSVIVLGVGKSRIAAEKISSTLASVGLPSFPMCALEAFHGDLGRLHRGNVLLALSSSGETEEVISVARYSRAIGVLVASITRSRSSTLALNSDLVIAIGSCPEAAPYRVLPNTSTTVMIAIGDALAMALVSYLRVTPAQLAQYHPAGNIGRILR